MGSVNAFNRFCSSSFICAHNTCRGSEFIGNAASAGGAIYVDAGCSLKLDASIHFYNNTATQASSGGAIYLGAGAQLTIDRRAIACCMLHAGA